MDNLSDEARSLDEATDDSRRDWRVCSHGMSSRARFWICGQAVHQHGACLSGLLGLWVAFPRVGAWPVAMGWNSMWVVTAARFSTTYSSSSTAQSGLDEDRTCSLDCGGGESGPVYRFHPDNSSSSAQHS